MCENTTIKFSFSLVMAQECYHSDSLTHFIHSLTLVLIEFFARPTYDIGILSPPLDTR